MCKQLIGDLRPVSLFLSILILGLVVAGSTSAQGVDSKTLYTSYGDTAGDGYGYSVSGAGDVNNDGFKDFIIGAPRDDNNGTDSGCARILSGRDGTILYTFNGPASYACFGAAVGGVGDVNNDGHDDVIVGAPYDAPGSAATRGSVTVFSGKYGTVLYTVFGDQDGDLFGHAVSGVGDVNHDTCPDFIVGAPGDDRNGTNSGLARVFSGEDGTVLYTYVGGGENSNVGYSVSGAGDVNNDGWVDFIVGEPYFGPPSMMKMATTRVYSGKDGTVLAWTGGKSTSHLGASVCGAGDVDRDGWDDFIVGAPNDDRNGAGSGTVHVFSGATSMMPKPIFTFVGSAAGDHLGSSVGGNVDVDRDGYPDILVGACGSDAGGLDAGSVQVYSGRTGALLFTLSGDTAGDALGWSVSGVGDANLDGYDDIIACTLKDLGSGSAPGYARVASVTYPDDAAVTAVAVNWSNPKAPLKVSASVMNTGIQNIASLDVLIFLDLNSNKVLDELEPSMSVVLTDVLTNTTRKAVASFTDPPGGAYLAVAVADPNDLIQESHEQNNTGFGPVIIRLPDLVVNGCTWTSAPGSKPGTYDVTLKATIQNIGDATADNVTVSFQYIALRSSSGKQIKVIRTIGGPVNVGTLQPNASTVATMIWRRVSPINGTMLYVIVDPNDRIREMSESNEFSFLIHVP